MKQHTIYISQSATACISSHEQSPTDDSTAVTIVLSLAHDASRTQFSYLTRKPNCYFKT